MSFVTNLFKKKTTDPIVQPQPTQAIAKVASADTGDRKRRGLSTILTGGEPLEEKKEKTLLGQ